VNTAAQEKILTETLRDLDPEAKVSVDRRMREAKLLTYTPLDFEAVSRSLAPLSIALELKHQTKN
jgi:hypothetical protein